MSQRSAGQTVEQSVAQWGDPREYLRRLTVMPLVRMAIYGESKKPRAFCTRLLKIWLTPTSKTDKKEIDQQMLMGGLEPPTPEL